jgi:hypothetical protein
MNNKEDKNKTETAENKIDENCKKEWKKPTFEDVSERIMAQPYIRFT